MGIKTEKIDGKKILNEYVSSNILSSVYDREDKTLKVTFKGGRSYVYDKVPFQVFTKMRISESQGKFFNREISKKYRYREIK
jgi:hypothetical protein